MIERLQIAAWITDQEFRGESFNGKPLTELLGGLSAQDAASTATHEGYSIWGVALHLAYWKFYLTAALGGDPGEFPYEAADWPHVPTEPDDAAWKAVRDYLESIHDRYIATLEGLDDAHVNRHFERWKTPYWKLIGWMATHDSYHVAQIRSMGAPGLAPQRAGAAG